MDSAETRQWLEALSTQEARLSRQEQFQTTMAEHLGQLRTQVWNLTDLHDQPACSTEASGVCGNADAGCLLRWIWASCGKPFTEGEFVKKCLNVVVEEVCPEKKDVFNAVSLSVGCRLHFLRPLGCCCWLRAVHLSVPLTACRWSLSGSVDPPVPRCVGRDRLIGAEPTVVDWCPGHGVPFLLC
ncbi:hypothetical protein JOB18_003976 [Solea senegalensis]|uniref:PH domain-containing protein n=1 Tax=Solea senegalensis TaxID=28829 RepID=A0AAV6RT80_SOLSE|nr:hypothetical protein JOB18_003976 [Solea senegalensis]